VAEENVRAVVTLNEEYETRFLCCSAQVSPRSRPVPPGRVPRRSPCPGAGEASAASRPDPGGGRHGLWQRRLCLGPEADGEKPARNR